METHEIYCCNYLKEKINEKDTHIGYLNKFREFYIDSKRDKYISFTIDFCPWCGSNFPKNLREEYFETLDKEYEINTNIMRYKTRKDIPSEFKTDEWWKKRGL